MPSMTAAQRKAKDEADAAKNNPPAGDQGAQQTGGDPGGDPNAPGADAGAGAGEQAPEHVQSGPSDPPPAPPAPPAPAAGGSHFQFAVPKALKGKRGIDILMDACERYGVNPDPDLKPIELMGWNFYPEDLTTGAPAYIVMVTGGGIKIRHYDDPDWPMDPDTEERLRNVFAAFKVDPATKLPVPQPLPDDLTLPPAAVDGIGRTQDHRYRGGYLRAGGKVEAARRAKERKTRPKRS